MKKFGTLLGSSLVLLMMTCIVGGCASTASHFDRITPGMTSVEVRKAMDNGPTHFESIANTEYSTWSFGDDYCVLFKSDRVVGKDTTRTGASASSSAGVGYTEQRKAQCLAPGQSASGVTERSINIPGIGTVHLPSSKLHSG